MPREMVNHSKSWCRGIVAAAIALASGCGWVPLPDLYHPGPAGYQRARAIQHDPFPLDDVAEPVVGGRPREYQRPVPEPERAVQYDERHPRAAAPAPATFAPAPIGAPMPLGAPPPALGSGYGIPSSGVSPYATSVPTSPPAASYQLSVPASPVQPAPYPYGSPTPATPPSQFRPPY